MIAPEVAIRRGILVLFSLVLLAGCSREKAVTPLVLAESVEPAMATECSVLVNGRPLPSGEIVWKCRDLLRISVRFRKGTVAAGTEEQQRNVPFDEFFGTSRKDLFCQVIGTETGDVSGYVGEGKHARPKSVGPVWESGEFSFRLPAEPGRYAFTLNFEKSLGERPSDDGLHVVEDIDRRALFRRDVTLIGEQAP